MNNQADGMWNYRVIKKGQQFAIYEVYYDDMGNPFAFTEEPCHPYGESVEELTEDMSYFQKALELPVLDYEELEKQCEERGSAPN